MKEIKKYIWKIKYKDTDTHITEKEIITEGYPILAFWLKNKLWGNTIIQITLDRVITELIPDNKELIL
jgi:hypothetical protein